MSDDHHVCDDARRMARLIASGVVSEEQAVECLAKAWEWAANAGSARSYAAAMRVPQAVANLRLKQRALALQAKRGDAHSGGVNFYGPTQIKLASLTDEQLEQLERLLGGGTLPGASPTGAVPQ